MPHPGHRLDLVLVFDHAEDVGRCWRLLVEESVISEEQLERSLLEQQKTGDKLGRVLVTLGYMTENELMSFLANQIGVPYVDIKRRPPTEEALDLIPAKVARR